MFKVGVVADTGCDKSFSWRGREDPAFTFTLIQNPITLGVDLSDVADTMDSDFDPPFALIFCVWKKYTINKCKNAPQHEE